MDVPPISLTKVPSMTIDTVDFERDLGMVEEDLKVSRQPSPLINNNLDNPHNMRQST